MIGDNRAYYVILPVLVFIIPPALFWRENLDELQHLDSEFTIVTLVSSAVFSILLLFLADRVLSFVGLAFYFGCAARFLSFFFMCTGLIAPLSVETGMVDPEHLPLDFPNLVISTAVATILFAASSVRVRNLLSTTAPDGKKGGALLAGLPTALVVGVVVSFVGLNFLISIHTFYSLMIDDGLQMESIFEVSRERNILVLSFDGLSRDMSLEVLRENEEFQESFKDFSVYSNVISSSPATVASIYSELLGNRNFKDQFPTEKGFFNYPRSALLTNHLDDSGYIVSTYGAYTASFSAPQRAFGKSDLWRRSSLAQREGAIEERILETVGFFDHALVRIASSYFVLGDGFANAIIEHLGSLMAQPDTGRAFTGGARWDRQNARTRYDFDAYMENLRPVERAPVAHFLHFTYTHFPVDFDAGCEYKSDDEEWYSSHQTRDGAKAESYCVFSELSEFLFRLKDLGIYDESLVVIKSDHGKPVRVELGPDGPNDQYYDRSKLESFKIRENPYWGYGRYTPFLAIKGFNARSDAPEYDERPVMLGDLARTICLNAGADMSCDSYPGYDLLDRDLSIPESDEAVIFLVKNKDSNFKFDSHDAFHILRKRDFYGNLHDLLTAEILTSSVSCGEYIEFGNGRVFNNGFSDYRSWLTWRDAGSSFLRFGASRCKNGDMEIGFHVESPDPDRGTGFDLYLDGVIQDRVAVAPGDSSNGRATVPLMVQPGETGDHPGLILLELRPREEGAENRITLTSVRFSSAGGRDDLPAPP